MKVIRIGDRKPMRTLDASKPHAELVLDAYDKIEEEQEETRLLQLEKKRRAVSEAAKKRF